MLGITHVLFAAFLGIAASRFLLLDPLPTIAFVVLGALLPDIDHPKSYLGRYFKPLSWFVKHRGIFHTIVGAVAVAILLEFGLRALGLFRTPFPVLLLLGYCSHLFLDALTKQGVKLFYPANLQVKGKKKTGSFSERVIAVALFLLIIWLLL